MYWPKEGTEIYGMIQVRLIKEDILAMYTVRTLSILHSKTKRKKHGFNERLVYQYHYTNWPDHGTPDHPLPILSFVKKSSASNPHDAGPIVVHCSAGVGRTGTYIVLDSMLKQICHKNEVNVYGFLRHIRTQRNFLVQTEEQYIFIHDALLEAITCSESSLSAECLSHLLKTSALPDHSHEHWKKLETHFQALTAFQPKDYNLVSANKPCNQVKNRSQQFIPVECSRVHLTPKPGVDGSDYINASWCLGFKKLREFILTQHPLTSTVFDFWQMVWDHNAQTVVLLSPLTPDSEEYCVFWPAEGETLDGENFKVKLIEESELDGTVSRDLTVQSLQDDCELTVRIIQSPVPEPLSDLPALFQLLSTVQQWHLEYQNGPIIVIDRFGGTEAATFCCLATLTKQLDYENHADICMYAKLYHNRRPGVWQTMDSYLLLYQALEVLSASKGVSLVPSPSPTHLQPNGYNIAVDKS
uniref:Protein-tyrosine-phosphatase n=1 Tax=Homalodisca liturata TaxID=320908 RepID=A0A1B6I8F7_9HEMI